MNFKPLISRILFFGLLAFFSCAKLYSEDNSQQKEEDSYLFYVEVNADNINIRTDSTSSAEMICKVNKGEQLEAVSSSYDWYKIRLPKIAPSFIRKDLLKGIDEKTAQVIKESINIRLKPDTSSPILGKIKKGQTVNIVKESEDWYRIEPVENSFGWIHKSFADKIEEKKIKVIKKPKKEEAPGAITIIGLIKPKSITREATHKITAEDNKLYLLRGEKNTLDSFIRRKVKITGKVVDSPRPDPILRVETIEALD